MIEVLILTAGALGGWYFGRRAERAIGFQRGTDSTLQTITSVFEQELGRDAIAPAKVCAHAPRMAAHMLLDAVKWAAARDRKRFAASE